MISQQTLKGNLLLQDYTTAFTLNQGDKGVPFKVELLENGTPYTLQSTDIVTIEWLKPNGNPFLQEGDILYGTTYIEFTTPESVAQYSGSGSFNIIISNSDVRKGTIRREYKVVPTSMKPGSVSEDVITDAITELRELSVEIADTVQNNQDLINNNQAATKQDIANVNSSLEDIANNRSDWLNVTQFGILPSNSSSENNANFNDLISLALAQDKHVFYFPGGTYNLQIKLEYSSLEKEDLNFVFVGDGDSSIITYAFGDTAILKGSGNSTTANSKFLKSIKFKDLNFNGFGKEYNCFNLDTVQYVKFDNVYVHDYNLSSLKSVDAFDCNMTDSRILRCALSLSDDITCSVFYFTSLYDCTNAFKIINTHIETTPSFCYFDEKVRHIYFTNCKFEKSYTNTIENKRPFQFSNSLEVSFNNCMFVNHKNTRNTEAYTVDGGLPFIKTVSDNLSWEETQFIKFTSCNFTSDTYGRSIWFDGDNTKFLECDFAQTHGWHDKFPFVFNSNCNMADTTVYILENSQFAKLNGNNNKIECDIKLEATATKPSIYISDVSSDNTMNIGVIGENDVIFGAVTNALNDNLLNNKISKKYYSNRVETSTTLSPLLNPDTVTTSNSSLVNITNCFNGQIIRVISDNENGTTVDTTGNIKTKDGSAKVIAKGSMLSFIYNNRIAYEI